MTVQYPVPSNPTRLHLGRLFVVEASPPSSRAKGWAEAKRVCVWRGGRRRGKREARNFQFAGDKEGGEEEEEEETGNACPTL